MKKFLVGALTGFSIGAVLYGMARESAVNEGYEEGYQDGEDNGYYAGFDDGVDYACNDDDEDDFEDDDPDDAYDRGYQHGREIGHHDGFVEGQADGYAVGVDEVTSGEAERLEMAREEGKQEALYHVALANRLGLLRLEFPFGELTDLMTDVFVDAIENANV